MATKIDEVLVRFEVNSVLTFRILLFCRAKQHGYLLPTFRREFSFPIRADFLTLADEGGNFLRNVGNE